MTWQQWIQIVEVPAILFLATMIYRNRVAADTRLEKTREDLAQFQIKVANDYVSVRHLKDVESRIMRGLERLETKLDAVAGAGRGHD